MRLESYETFNETRINPIKGELKNFDGRLQHKVVLSNTGDTYNTWIPRDKETSNKLSRYVGKYAIDLGGYAPSIADIWMSCGDFSLIIKTNKDNIIPDEVIISAAQLLRKQAGVEDEEGVVNFTTNKFVFVVDGRVILDEVNSSRVLFTNGNIRIDI